MINKLCEKRVGRRESENRWFIDFQKSNLAPFQSNYKTLFLGELKKKKWELETFNKLVKNNKENQPNSNTRPM